MTQIENVVASDQSPIAHEDRPSPARSAGKPSWFALRQDIPRSLYYSAAAGAFAALIALWWWASHSANVETAYLPPPEVVWKSALEQFRESMLWDDLKVSFLRVTAGFLLSAA